MVKTKSMIFEFVFVKIGETEGKEKGKNYLEMLDRSAHLRWVS